MVSKRFALLGIFALSIGAAIVGTLWNLQGDALPGQLAAGTSQVIDDGDSGFSTTGKGWQTYQHALGYKGDITSPTTNTDTSLAATWTFTNVPAGQYKFFVTFKAYTLLTNQAFYVVRDGASLLGSVTLNQKVDPTGNTYDGKNWVLLGTYTVKGPSVAITLRRPQVLSANGMIADGARIERVGGSATPYAAAPAAVASSAKSAVALPTLTTLPAQDTAPSVMPLVTQSDTAGAGVGGAAGGAPVAGYPSRNCPQGYPNCSCPLSMNWRECGEWSCPNANREFDELRNQCVCREGWGCADGSDSPYCDCQPLSCPDGYWLNPETYTCIPNTVCGDGYLDRTGFPREICELDGNRGCPEGEFCLNCTSCLVCGDTLLTNNEECEADFTCPLGTSCSASCQCSDSATSQSKNTTILDISSHLMTQTTISSDITRTSWTVPVRTGETYDIYVRTQKYNMTMNNNRMYACPTNFWKVFNGSTRVLPLSNDQKLQYGDPLCYPDSYASVSPTWILLTQIQASATSIRVEHEPSPLPANASATDPARRLAIADSIRIEKVADASSSSSSAWTDCPSGYSCPVLWVNNQCARRSITCGIGKILQCDSTCGNGDCSGPCCKCVQGSSSSRSSSSSSSTSSLACVQEGQSAAVLPGAATCCSGLNGVVATGPLQDGSCSDALPGGAFRCVRCGNGSCGLGENYCNCLADCPRPQSSSSSSSVSSAWTTCSGDFLCTALWSGNQCAYRSIDCPIGFNTLCNTACGNSVCPGACCKCVPGSSSSRSSSASSTSATGIAWTQVGPPHTSGNSCATECAARGQTCAATGCVPSTTWNGMTFTGGEKIVANGANYSYTCSNDWGAIHQSYQNYCCCTGSAPVLSSSSSRSFSSVPSVTCTDSDGNDPFTAGTVQIGNQTYRDDCTTCGSNSLPCLAVDERLCDGSQVTSEIKNCSALRAGFICKDGRCVTACGDGMVNMGEQCDGTLISACSPGQTCSADCRCVSEPPSSVQWQTVGSSYLVSTLSDYALFGHGSYLYLVGGNDFWGATKSELRSEDGLSWRNVASLPQPLANAAALQSEGSALLLGGLADRDSVVTWAFASPNLLSNGFTSSPSYALPIPRYDGAVLRLGDQTFFLGGYYKATPFNGSLLGSLLGMLAGSTAIPYPSNEIYLHNGTSWSRLQPDLPFHVTKDNAFAIGNRLFILDHSSPRKVFASSNGTTWTQVSTLPTATAGKTFLKPTLHEGAIWLLATSADLRGSAVVTTDGLTWRMVTGTFPSDLNDFIPNSAVSFQGELWVLGTVSDYYIGGNGRNGKVLRTGVSVGPACGDGSRDSTEACDDGDTSNGDGCSSSCQIESGWICDGQPSNCARWNECEAGYSCTAVPYFGNDNAWHCGRTGGLEPGCHEERNDAGCGNADWCGTAYCKKVVCGGSSSSSSSSAPADIVGYRCTNGNCQQCFVSMGNGCVQMTLAQCQAGCGSSSSSSQTSFVCPALSPPFCSNGILVPQMSTDANGCRLPPVCCEGANNPTAQCSLDLTCGGGTCIISSCSCH